jgi:hypothetical protein
LWPWRTASCASSGSRSTAWALKAVVAIPLCSATRRATLVRRGLSPLEGNGFEPSVPVAKKSVFVAEGELRGWKGAAHREVFLLRGTDGSNLSPSSGESIANPTFSIRTNPVSGFAVDCRLALDLALEGSRGRVQHWRRCRGPPSDGVAGAGRDGRDRGCRRRFARCRGWIPPARCQPAQRVVMSEGIARWRTACAAIS